MIDWIIAMLIPTQLISLNVVITQHKSAEWPSNEHPKWQWNKSRIKKRLPPKLVLNDLMNPERECWGKRNVIPSFIILCECRTFKRTISFSSYIRSRVHNNNYSNYVFRASYAGDVGRGSAFNLFLNFLDLNRRGTRNFMRKSFTAPNMTLEPRRKTQSNFPSRVFLYYSLKSCDYLIIKCVLSSAAIVDGSRRHRVTGDSPEPKTMSSAAEERTFSMKLSAFFSHF